MMYLFHRQYSQVHIYLDTDTIFIISALYAARTELNQIKTQFPYFQELKCNWKINMIIQNV